MSKKKKKIKSAAAGMAVAGAAVTGAVLTSEQEKEDSLNNVNIKESRDSGSIKEENISTTATQDTQLGDKSEVESSAKVSARQSAETESVQNETASKPIEKEEEIIADLAFSVREKLNQLSQSIQNI
ncbi:hypothetical protein [Lishizhenia sp.]|uniref:hypothetical protein n=1 Tax=Lishizhenia sp. TaxID=2497594 RepID=UPI00299CD793|nr:hypothetical protein [Lishizhenia sp.]MDX1444938.1 hypothetical protein [Lishizhenia sp.]